MKRVNQLLGDADKSIRNSKFIGGDKKTIDGVYKGYVASLGAAVIMSGLVPALAFYYEDDKRRKVMDVVAEVSGLAKDTKALFDLLKHEADRLKLKAASERVLDASIAVKIMMRTYEFTEPKNDDDE